MDNELQGSGINYSVEYLGSIPIESSIQEMTTDLRVLVVQECIYILANAHNLLGETHEVNNVARKVIGECQPKISKEEDGVPSKVDLNISAKQIRIVKGDRMLARHPTSHVSFAAQGAQKCQGMLGYVAKKQDGTNRQCFVFRFKEINRLMTAIHESLRIFAESKGLTSVPFNGHSQTSSAVPIVSAPRLMPTQINSQASPLVPPSCGVYQDEPYRPGSFRPVNASRPRRSRPLVCPTSLPIRSSPGHQPGQPGSWSSPGRMQGSPSTWSPNRASPFESPTEDDIVVRNARAMEQYSWYHGLLSRTVAESLLKADGDFLVRQSTNTPGQIILSSMSSHGFKHILVLDKGLKEVRTEDRSFDSVVDLVLYHHSTGEPIKTAEDTVRLVCPIARHRSPAQ